ncbi:copper-containing nitrite reductase [Comamonas terrigena]|jgi:nitrite reductase (NO-forming)|uniref:copper-containing nitrite reductase n=1 Tax=Comamonas terrigena TaxID=32013 RepID=UPI0023561A80|nr:copper-containing nitrite reductase [Comamonas terrigena]MDH1290403.1 copper-containing nitrite reductase [Comamonas terrigena]
MTSTRCLTPVAFAIALALNLAPSLGSAQTAPTAAAAKKAATAQVRKVALTTNIVDGKMVYVNAKGQVNPTIVAEVGDTVEIVLQSGEGAEHDLAVEGLNVVSKKVNADTGPATLRFQVTKAGTFSYYCTIPGHRQIGMEGKLEVKGTTVEAEKAVQKNAPGPEALYTPAAAMAPALAGAVSIAADPSAVPPAVKAAGPQKHQKRIETVELVGQLDDGTTFTYWTFDKQVPGPMLRMKQGDTMELTLANAKSSKMIHSIDLHAVNGGLGGGEHTQVPPGQEKTITFKALNPGLYVYHCATPLVPHHIMAGMYGMILVEPEGGLPQVDKEFYVMQGEMYTTRPIGAKTHQEVDFDKMAAELPQYYVFNGAVGALTKEHKLKAKVGEKVRIYFGVGGPNKISSFHVIGEVFDKVYDEASLTAIKHNVQTTVVPPGGAAIVELTPQVPGNYLLVDHALSRTGKGLVGILEVSGQAEPGVYSGVSDPNAAHGH